MAKLTKSAKEVRGRKMLAVRLKDGRYHSSSSNRWLERQLNDPYVAEAKQRGYRSRAAFKLIQLDETYKFLDHIIKKMTQQDPNGRYKDIEEIEFNITASIKIYESEE